MPFTSMEWSSPKSDLDAADYCSLCLIDLNEGSEKVKDRCKLPVKSMPGGPHNLHGMAAAAAALVGGRGGVDAPREAKVAAARKLVRLYREAKQNPPELLVDLAGG